MSTDKEEQLVKSMVGKTIADTRVYLNYYSGVNSTLFKIIFTDGTSLDIESVDANSYRSWLDIKFME